MGPKPILCGKIKHQQSIQRNSYRCVVDERYVKIAPSEGVVSHIAEVVFVKDYFYYGGKGFY